MTHRNRRWEGQISSLLNEFKQVVSRRSFIGRLARLIGMAAGTGVLLPPKKAESAGYYNLGAFWKKPNESSGADDPSSPGTLWALGANAKGSFGDGVVECGVVPFYSSPIQVNAATNWTYITTANNGTLGIRSDNTLWAWGSNLCGALGVGATGDNTCGYASSPIQVGALTNWKKVVAAGYADGASVYAIKTDGTLWSWGYGYAGIGTLGHGDGSGADISSPVQVGSLTNWKSIASSPSHHVAGIKTNGTLWMWGYNVDGPLGLGDETPRSSPVQVGSLSNWKSISSNGGFVAAIKTDGTLWTWGTSNGLSASLGLGDTLSRSSPVQVGSLTTWATVSAGYDHAHAVKTDGTLWSWGSNSLGQLGLGDGTNRSSPVQVGSLTNWQFVNAGNRCSIAIKTDGTCWYWGNGRFGGGPSSPVQLGSDTNWARVDERTTVSPTFLIRT